MGEPIKQLQATYEDNLIIPEPLLKTVQNFRKAHHGYKFDDKEQAYIEYNTLREQQIDTEEITIKKIQRLFDRDNQTEHLVIFQESRVKDYNNNIVKCPIVEKLGVVPEPVANISNDARNKVRDVTVVETKNEYYIPFSKEKLIQLFETSKDRHKIVCYIGFTRPTRVNSSDTIEGKKIIWNQDKFVNAEFSELTDTDEDVIKVLDTRKQYIIPNRVRDVNKVTTTTNNKGKSQRVETISELLTAPSSKKKKRDQQDPEDIAYSALKEYEDKEDEIKGNSTTNEIVNDTKKEFDEIFSNKDD